MKSMRYCVDIKEYKRFLRQTCIQTLLLKIVTIGYLPKSFIIRDIGK